MNRKLFCCTSERKGTSDKARQKTVLWKLSAMKTKWNADNGKIYITCLTHNRTAFLNIFIFRYESQSEYTWLHSLTDFQFGWGGRIWTLEITESESAALPLGDTPVFCILLSFSVSFYIISQRKMFVKAFFKIFLKKQKFFWPENRRIVRHDD